MDLDEIHKLIQEGKSREEIEIILKERHPRAAFEKTHRGVTLIAHNKDQIMASGWVSGPEDDKIELGIDFFLEKTQKENLERNNELAAKQASKRNTKNATKYTNEIIDRIFKIVDEEKRMKDEHHPALKRSLDRINQEFKENNIRIEDSPSLSNLLSKFRKNRKIGKK